MNIGIPDSWVKVRDPEAFDEWLVGATSPNWTTDRFVDGTMYRKMGSHEMFAIATYDNEVWIAPSYLKLI